MNTYIAIFLCFFCIPAGANWYSERATIMGTDIRVELWAEKEEKAKEAIQVVFSDMRSVEDQMSPYKPNSELSQLNNSGLDGVHIKANLFQLIEQSLFYSKLSNGAFDISYAAAGRRYNYRHKVKPNDWALKSSLSQVNYRQILLNEKKSHVRFAKEGMAIDLGGIAKGYAVDRSTELLWKLGIQHAVVTAGGDSRLLGDKRGRPWMMGVKHPRQADHFIAALPLENMAISTSGDYERYFIDDRTGERIHHILNPKTGKSVSGLSSVTIIAENATETDALSTAVFVMGLEPGMALINRLPGVEAVIVTEKGVIKYSKGLHRPTPSE